jgi:glyoxylase-like metal-dependent hydrolase (beta-lactamase superfamily II)
MAMAARHRPSFADTRADIVYSGACRSADAKIDTVFRKNHANDGTAVLFRNERVLFTTDFPADALVQKTMRSMPSACGPFDGHSMDEWIKSYRTLEALDFDISVGGHGTVPFTKQDIAEGREFFEYLKHEVQAAMSKGMSLEQMKKTLMLEPYKSWRHYDQLRAWNIEAAYYNLKTFK